MRQPEGWYPDPDGFPVQRYWDGQVWTEHTEPQPPPPVSHPTVPLPYWSPAVPSRPWYRRRGWLIGAGAAVVVIVLAVIGGAAGSSGQHTAGPPSSASPTPTRATPPVTAPTGLPTSPPTAVTSSLPAPTTAAPSTSRPPSAKPPAGSWVMPDEVGQVLQDAQDDIQRVSGDPVFVSHSHDLRGRRHQILDRDWKVCTQNVPPGARVSAVGHVDFGVVKRGETCPVQPG